MTKGTISRRGFIGTAAATGLFQIVPRHVLGGPAHTPPSEKLHIARHHPDLVRSLCIYEPTSLHVLNTGRSDDSRLIEEIRERGNLPVLVGGTMLYFRALRRGLAALPGADPGVRAALDALPKVTGGAGDIHLGNDTGRVLNQADKLSQQRGDAYISSELVLLLNPDTRARGPAIDTLVEGLRERYPEARFCGIGGQRMQAAGVEAWWDSEELAVMGLFEVLGHLPRLLRLRRELRRRLSIWRRELSTEDEEGAPAPAAGVQWRDRRPAPRWGRPSRSGGRRWSEQPAPGARRSRVRRTSATPMSPGR